MNELPDRRPAPKSHDMKHSIEDRGLDLAAPALSLLMQYYSPPTLKTSQAAGKRIGIQGWPSVKQLAN
jgi:hypothetical protein